MTHTPTPSLAIVSESASHIAFVNGGTYSRGEVIRAVNCHSDLVRALKEILYQAPNGRWFVGVNGDSDVTYIVDDVMRKAEAK